MLTKQAQLNQDPALARPSGAASNRDTQDRQALPTAPSVPGRTVSRLESELPAMTTEMLEQACKAGNFDGCRFLAKRLLSTPPYQVARARQLLEPACARGGFEDCWDLGEFLLRSGPHQDAAKAAELLRRATQLAEAACRREEVGGCTRLAWAYRYGIGVPRDESKASEYMVRMATLSVAQQKQLAPSAPTAR